MKGLMADQPSKPWTIRKAALFSLPVSIFLLLAVLGRYSAYPYFRAIQKQTDLTLDEKLARHDRLLYTQVKTYGRAESEENSPPPSPYLSIDELRQLSLASTPEETYSSKQDKDTEAEDWTVDQQLLMPDDRSHAQPLKLKEADIDLRDQPARFHLPSVDVQASGDTSLRAQPDMADVTEEDAVAMNGHDTSDQSTVADVGEGQENHNDILESEDASDELQLPLQDTPASPSGRAAPGSTSRRLLASVERQNLWQRLSSLMITNNDDVSLEAPHVTRLSKMAFAESSAVRFAISSSASLPKLGIAYVQLGSSAEDIENLSFFLRLGAKVDREVHVFLILQPEQVRSLSAL